MSHGKASQTKLHRQAEDASGSRSGSGQGGISPSRAMTIVHQGPECSPKVYCLIAAGDVEIVLPSARVPESRTRSRPSGFFFFSEYFIPSNSATFSVKNILVDESGVVA